MTASNRGKQFHTLDLASLGESETVAVNDIKFYHTGEGRHARMPTILPEDRPFVVWDGEGVRNKDNPSGPQDYALFGYHCDGDTDWIESESLSLKRCLAFIVAVGKRYRNAFHVWFAGDYDTNMILKEMSVRQFEMLKDKGSVLIDEYRIEHVYGKWMQVTKYGPTYNRGKGNRNDKFTVRIADIFGFFQTSFVKACKSYIPHDPLMSELETIEEGKAERNKFTFARIEYIRNYWKTEIRLLHSLVTRLREMLYRVGLTITRWHGPGAIANFVYKSHGIARHKALTPPEVREAARYAYSAGRFELYHIGRFECVHGIDLNSAYPFAISKLPSLSEGNWRHVDHPTSIVEFGVYHVRLNGFAGPISRPGPLFHRDMAHNITYPWKLEGWYWSPEIIATLRALKVSKRNDRGFEIIEGYEYTGWHTRPFAFVKDMYAHRQELKARGDGGQIALKLALNSLYGKMAQRVGWERNGKPPTWHQLEWAGWVTSYTRAMLYGVMAQIPYEKLIAVETDGIYTTMDPADLGIRNSKALGGWEVTEYKEMLYVQSGVYAARTTDGWNEKYRGLDSGSLPASSFIDYLYSLRPSPTKDDAWPLLIGPTTRFIGYRSALHRQSESKGNMKRHHCRWETVDREISPGEVGKRVHSPKLCTTCREGLCNAYEKPHDLVIKSRTMLEPHSTMHSIPWEDNDNADTAEWRLYAAAHSDELILR